MIKTKLTIALLCLSFAGIVSAQQTSPQVQKMEPQMEDIYNVLEAMNIHIFRFDMKEFLNQVYAVSIYVDEYENGQTPKRLSTRYLGNNIESLDNVPEEHRQTLREIKQIPEGKNEWEEIKEISVYLRKSNDSTAVCMINIPGSSRQGVPLKLRPVEKYHSFHYRPLPFKLQPISQQGNLKIPLLLYGSAWLDKQHNIIRFCGENEIDPEMKAKILNNIPHYYVIGIELKSNASK